MMRKVNKGEFNVDLKSRRASMGGGQSSQHCVCSLVSAVVRAEALSNECSTQYICMLHYKPPSVHLCLLPSLTQTLSSLSFFLSSTKHRFTVLPIKAYIHSANYQWHDSFGLVPVPLISPLPFPSSFSLEEPTENRIINQCHVQSFVAYMRLPRNKSYLGISLHVQITISHW